MSERLAGRTALVTGASRGIGAAVAQRFAAEGAHVVLVARTQGGLEEVDDAIRAKGGSATLLPLDLRDFEQVDRIGPALFERFGSLDVFVGNAATIGPLSPVGHIVAKDWDGIIALNLTANFRLARTLDPLLRRSAAGRAILVTCAAGRHPDAYWGAYAASKAGLESLALSWAAETRKTSLRINLLDPGPVFTRLRRSAFPLEEETTLRKPQDVTEAFVTLAEIGCTRHGERVQA